jgi:hypothetical protein
MVVREVEILSAISRIETRNLFAKEIPCTFIGNGAISHYGVGPARRRQDRQGDSAVFVVCRYATNENTYMLKALHDSRMWYTLHININSRRWPMAEALAAPREKAGAKKI